MEPKEEEKLKKVAEELGQVFHPEAINDTEGFAEELIERWQKREGNNS